MKAMIVDKHELFRAGLKKFLISHDVFTEVIEAKCYESALCMQQENDDVGLIITDLHMHGINGTRGVEELIRLARPTPLVVISAEEETATMRELILTGAAGYIQKASPMNVIMHAIQVVLDGGIYLPHRSMLSAPNEVKITPKKHGQLSGRQMEILELLTKGMTNKEIGAALYLAEGTVKQNLVTIYEHLNVKSRTQAIVSTLGLNSRLQ